MNPNMNPERVCGFVQSASGFCEMVREVNLPSATGEPFVTCMFAASHVFANHQPVRHSVCSRGLVYMAPGFCELVREANLPSATG